MTLRHGLRALALGGVLALAAAGCGSHKAASAAPSAPAPGSSSAPAAAADSPAPGDAEPSASSSGAVGGTCKAADMAETVYGGSSAAGSVLSGVALTNKASKACTVSGFPTITFVDDKGTPYKYTLEHARTAGSKFSVAAGGKAYFTIKLGSASAAPTKQGPCDPAAAAMRISLAADGSGYATDQGPWHACGLGQVGPLTAKPDPNLHK